MKVFRILFILLLILPLFVKADSYQETSCSNISKNLRGGDIIPSSCMDMFKSESDFFKQVSSKDQNLGVWIKKNLLLINLEKKKNGKWLTELKLIGGKELSGGKIIDFDISPEPVFENTFEINILIEEENQFKVITHLSSQKNGQKPRVAHLLKSPETSQLISIFRGKDRKIWLENDRHQIFSMDAAANSMSQNKKDHPVLKKSPFSSNSKIDFISSRSETIVMLSANNLIEISNGKETAYTVSGMNQFSKYECIRLEIENNKLIIKKGDRSIVNFTIYMAVE